MLDFLRCKSTFNHVETLDRIAVMEKRLNVLEVEQSEHISKLILAAKRIAGRESKRQGIEDKEHLVAGLTEALQILPVPQQTLNGHDNDGEWSTGNKPGATQGQIISFLQANPEIAELLIKKVL